MQSNHRESDLIFVQSMQCTCCNSYSNQHCDLYIERYLPCFGLVRFYTIICSLFLCSYLSLTLCNSINLSLFISTLMIISISASLSLCSHCFIFPYLLAQHKIIILFSHLHIPCQLVRLGEDSWN